jgi:hypothetical protein
MVTSKYRGYFEMIKVSCGGCGNKFEITKVGKRTNNTCFDCKKIRSRIRASKRKKI